MNELKITEEDVRNAAAKYPKAKQILEDLFPQAFSQNVDILYTGTGTELCTVGGYVDAIEIGEYAVPKELMNKCFVLNTNDFEWDLAQNNHRLYGLVLIPKRKF